MKKDPVEGFPELMKQFDQLSSGLQGKTLRSVSSNAATEFIKELRARIPKGNRIHKTYKGRTVAPGFASRNIKRRSTMRGPKASKVDIFLADEAWYARLYNDGFRRGARSKKVKRLSRKGSLSQAQLDKAGDSRKFEQGNQWIDKAYEAAEDKVFQRFATQMFRKMDQIVKRQR